MTLTDKPPTAVEMSDAEYFGPDHADKLSHSDCKLLLRSPALYRWVKDHHVRENKPEFDFGHAVHELVLGSGPGIDVIDADDWRLKDSREQRDESYEAGRAPLLRKDYERAQACAEAIYGHPIARKLLDRRDHTEIAMMWDDRGVERKAKADGVSGRIGFDVKSTIDAETKAFGRSAANFGYFTKDPYYRDAMRACLDIDDPGFLFVVVEHHPPHFVNVIEMTAEDVERGAQRNRRAIELFRKCRDADDWPAYGTGINTAHLPVWARIAEDEHYEEQEYTSW